MKRPTQFYPLVEVWWDDASEMEAGWTHEVKEPEPSLALSVGFLIHKGRKHIILALDTDAQGQHNGRAQIPRGMVKMLKVIRAKDALIPITR